MQSLIYGQFVGDFVANTQDMRDTSSDSVKWYTTPSAGRALRIEVFVAGPELLYSCTVGGSSPPGTSQQWRTVGL